MGSYDPLTPPTPMPAGDRIDIVIAMLRDLDRKLSRMASQVGDHEADIRAHQERIATIKDDSSDLKMRVDRLEQRKRSLKPEPHWAWRGAAISLVSAFLIVVMNWILKGGLSAGIGP